MTVEQLEALKREFQRLTDAALFEETALQPNPARVLQLKRQAADVRRRILAIEGLPGT